MERKRWEWKGRGESGENVQQLTSWNLFTSLAEMMVLIFLSPIWARNRHLFSPLTGLLLLLTTALWLRLDLFAGTGFVLPSHRFIVMYKLPPFTRFPLNSFVNSLRNCIKGLVVRLTRIRTNTHRFIILNQHCDRNVRPKREGGRRMQERGWKEDARKMMEGNCGHVEWLQSPSTVHREMLESFHLQAPITSQSLLSSSPHSLLSSSPTLSNPFFDSRFTIQVWFKSFPIASLIRFGSSGSPNTYSTKVGGSEAGSH